MSGSKQRSVPLPNDEPTLYDLLSLDPLVRQVGEAVAHCQPPHVFGIHGAWGSGKTSFLHQLQWYLTGECPQQPSVDPPAITGAGRHSNRVSVIWFETWRYQHEIAPIVALLHEIRAQLPFAAKALKETQKLFDVAIRGAFLSIEDLTKRIGIQASKIQEAGERWEADHLATQLPSHHIRQHLEEALSTLLGRKGNSKGRRLVVLVDDLDRCEPETAYQLLEGIKIYLNLPSCVFVLGMNQEIVEAAVAHHLALAAPTAGGKPGERERKAHEYLEKLCPSIWHLPLVENPGQLLEQYLKDGLEAEQIQALKRVVEDVDCLPPLPRKIKAYAGLLLRFRGSLSASWQETEEGASDRWAQIALLMTGLYHFHQKLYRILWKEKRDFYAEILKWCRGEESQVDPFRHLSLRHSKSADSSEPTGESGTFVSVFRDPLADEVFRFAGLVRLIGEINETEIKRHLIR